MKRVLSVFACVSVATLVFSAVVVVPVTVTAATSCESLTGLTLPNTTVTLAQTTPAGGFTQPGARGGGRGGDAASSLPAFCRVAATVKPSSDSDIKMEVWLPAAGWNGKLLAVGNGAFSGAIGYAAMMPALRAGYATTSTDTGHVGGSAEFALGHPEKVVDFGYRAVHEMTVKAKAIVSAYYENPLKYAYWNGCSAGGRQALKEAQKYPADYDGIIAGSPGLDWTGRATAALRIALVTNDEAARIPAAKAQLIHAAVLEACDAIDGIKDGVLDDPKRCKFDPGTLECKNGDAATCLTRAQTQTARLIYMSPVNPKTKREITGLEPGSELGWTDQGWSPSARATGLDQFRFLVYKDPAWAIDKFNFEADIVRAEEADADTLNALDPNLKPFFDRGGKLIQYHGWNDPQISPGNSVQYYQRVAEASGGAARVQASHRLFMAPGMGHCGGGEGPSSFDMVAALEHWVEQKQAPNQIIASRSRDGKVDRTRPLCPYPQVAAYKGTGSTDEAANFVCR
ncbi:MAG: tannase/feruloyl esterase family alpha/beta hydrolase [Acidobacteriota bacterium]